MANPSQHPGSPEPGPEERLSQSPPPPPGQPSRPPPGPYGAPPPPGHKPYAEQPVWRGHQAPQQGWHGGPPPDAPVGSTSRKAWLIPLLALLLVGLVVGGVLGALALTDGREGVSVSDIDDDDCLSSDDLAEGADSVAGIETVDCDEAHHAEVFAVLEFDEDQDENLDGAGSRCVQVAEHDEGRSLKDLEGDGLEIRPLVAGRDPQDGDAVVCFVRHKDGDELSESVFE